MVDWQASAPRWSSLGGNLASELELMISRGELKHGDKLPAERQLADSLGVSRTTLREALLQLEMRGLLSRRPGRGTIVHAPDSSPLTAELSGAFDTAHTDFARVMQLRQIIEPAVAAAAAEAVAAGGAELDVLSTLIEQAEGTTSSLRLLELDVAFHTAVAALVGNPLVDQLMHTVSDWTSSSRRLGFQGEARRHESIGGHRRILAALERGDATAAEAAMREHLAGIRRIVRGDGVTP